MALAAATAPLAGQQAELKPSVLTENFQPRTRSELGGFVDSLIADPMWRTAHWGVLIVDPERGDTLYSANAGKLFLPASNVKLVTAAVALAQLGGEYRTSTAVFGRRPGRDGAMPGDLVIVGRGDPSVSDSLAGDAMAPLRAIADSLAARGIKSIAGRLRRAGDAFPGDTLGLGWAWDDLDEGYAAPVDELLFNEGFARITVYGAERPGGPVRVRTHPARSLPRILRVNVETSRNCCMLRSRVRARSIADGGGLAFELTGSVRAGDSTSVNVALRNPSRAFLTALEEALASKGIRVDGGVDADSLADTTGMARLATLPSPPLTAMLGAFQKPSQNQLGEMLLRLVGLERTGVGTADSGLVVVRRQLAEWGVDSSGAALRDGSGLSRHNFLTPESIVRLLHVMRTRADFDAYYQALPVGGVDGTIRERMVGTPAMANVRAKTGTLDKARNLSGYVTTADGRVLLFSLMANNHTVPTREVERVQDAILVYLASMDGGLR
ncbi:MAG: D-alanyl-D-alanine carboxypeptidase/D-alanyl-D-alanine-endopeptidase [Gemmatimonadaceae bacterium]|nr:D-alanyl-D-alanine carboxypeptidase/D-alanyl-D-alanine-endopeptidase [Gemmatimonadaceae bacterium]